MSTLTKVFALFVSLLAIFLCGMVVTFMGMTNNYKDRYEEQKTLADAAQVVAYTAEERLERTVANYGRAAELNAERLSDMRKTYNAMSEQIAELEQSRTIESSKADTAIKLVAAMNELMSDMENAQKDLWASYDLYRAEKQKAQAESAELTRQLSNEQARTKQLEDTNRRRAEMIAAQEEQISGLNQKLARFDLAQREFEDDVKVSQVSMNMAGVPIVGEVTELEDNTVAISVGSTSGVQADMKFMVVRGDKFLGNLKIIYVEEDGAVGSLTNSQGVIVEGDMVTTNFN